VWLGAIKRNDTLSVVSRKDVEGAVAKWLTGARDRDEKRTQRAFRERLQREPASGDTTAATDRN